MKRKIYQVALSKQKWLLLSLAWSIALCLPRDVLALPEGTGYVPGILFPVQDPPQKMVNGLVSGPEGPMAGVSVTVSGSGLRRTVTNENGEYNILAEVTDSLTFSHVGMLTLTVLVDDRTVINVVLERDKSSLEEVTVVAFGKQDKASVISSIATIDPKDLQVPSSNLTTALAGRVSGMVAYQRSGEPGQDNADFFIRGVTTFGYTAQPLILIDGLQVTATDLANLNPDDVDNFSIMKDASASALYGSRAANGVILVTTKQGTEGKVKIAVRYDRSVSGPTSQVKLADPVTYMRLHNEAVTTRDPLAIPPYSREQIAETEKGLNPLLYPSVDWYGMLFKNTTLNDRFNFSASGGGNVARYYISGNYNVDNGILDVDPRSDFNSNIDLRKYMLRSNIDINVTKSTILSTKLYGTFDDYTGPIDGGQGLYNKVMRSNPVLFLPTYEPTNDLVGVKHILFGNYQDGGYLNPYADMMRGYRESTRSRMSAQFELHQDLGFVIDGLKLRGLFSVERYSFYNVDRAYNPFYYSLGGYNEEDDTYNLFAINPAQGREFLDYTEGVKDITSATYLEGAINYNKTIGSRHRMGAMVVSYMRSALAANAGSLQESLPQRNMGVSGRLNYNYDGRYFVEGNFGFNGSERFSSQNRYGFFPSVAAGWLVSGEAFWGDALQRVIPRLRFRSSYGLLGNDQIGDPSDRFFYLSQVNIGDSNRGYTFGGAYLNAKSGTSIVRYADPFISWETTKMTNLAVEFNLLSMLDFQVEVYKEIRTNILMDRAHINSIIGLQTTPRANVGQALGSGLDASVDLQQQFTDGFISGRFNFTYATSQFKVYEEPVFADEPWRSRIGYSIGQQWGYIAERLFVDQGEVANSPEQFGKVVAGDIKYKDMNGDGIINESDQVPIGFPTTPEITYGFGLSTGYKNFDFSFFFQGLARESFWIDVQHTAPFVDTDGSNAIHSQNQLLKVYADSYWSEDNRNLYAIWPRLSNELNTNNTQPSTWFMRDGSFLRLKSVELGYTVPTRLVSRLGLRTLRPYLSGLNLATFSPFKLWDPEMAGNGLGYPIQRVINVGIQVMF